MFRLLKSSIITVIYLLNCKQDSRSFTDLPRQSQERLIDDWIINEQERKILKRRFLDQAKIEIIAEEYDRSVRGIYYILKRGIKTMEKHM